MHDAPAAPDIESQPESTTPSRGPLPAVLSWVLGVGLLVGLGALALRYERSIEAVEVLRRDVAPTVVTDVLTGRLSDDRGRPARPKAGPGSTNAPLRLRFVPASDRSASETAIGSLVAFLEARTGYAFESAILQSYGLVVQELVESQCDIAFLTAASYARARFATEANDDPSDDIVAFLAAVRQGHPDYPGSDLAYRAAFLVHVDAPITRLDQITDATRVAMGPPTSGASSILPSALLNQMGVRPQVTRYAGGYPFIITAVLQRSVDVGCIWWSPPTPDNPENDARITVRSTEPGVFEKTRIVGFTEWIPNEPVVARAALPTEIREVLARALPLYIATRVTSEAGRRELEAVGSLIGYVPSSNDDFQPLLDTIKRAYANDPEGYADFTRGRKR